LGTPFPAGSLAAGVVVVLFFALLFFGLLVEGVWPWLDDFSGDEEVGCGVVSDGVVVVVVLVVLECEGEVEVELEVAVEVAVEVVVVVVVVDDEVEDDEVEDEDEDEADEELDELGDVVVVVVVVVVDDDDAVVGVVHVIVSETTSGRPRSGMTPGVPSTGTIFTTPPASVTATMHGSADATGMAARPRTTKIAGASSTTARNLRLNVKLVRPIPPPSTCASHASKSAAHSRAEGHATAWYGGLQFRTGAFTSGQHTHLARAPAGMEGELAPRRDLLPTVVSGRIVHAHGRVEVEAPGRNARCAARWL
jgi:hypothetical protein